MNPVYVYPAKSRFYSTGRWEVWNRFRSSSTMARRVENTQKVRGAASYFDPSSPNDMNFNELIGKPIKDTNRIKFFHSKLNSMQKNSNKVVITENLPEKYTYSYCINKFDVCGKTLNKFKEKVKSKSKKTRNLYFRLPVVCCNGRREVE